MTSKKVKISISLPEDWLHVKGITVEQFQDNVKFLIMAFGTRYPTVFPTDIKDTKDADFILSTSQLLQEVKDLPGFSRYVKIFDYKAASAYLFQARVAVLIKNTFSVELEPPTGNGSRMPDLKIETNSQPVYVECKTIDTNKFYKLDQKKDIAKRIRAILHTPNQIDIFFDDAEGVEKLFCKLKDKQFQKQIVDAQDTLKIQIEGGVHINVVPRITCRDLEISVSMKVIIEDNESGERKPGFVFMEAGHSTGIYGPLVDFSACLEEKRGQSRTQYVEGFPYVLALEASNILGDPNQNLSYIDRWFQPKINTRYSGVLLCKTFTRDGNSSTTEFEYLKNQHAAHEIGDDLEKFLIG